MKMVETSFPYEKPHIEILEVEIEKGFASSNGNFENPTEDIPGSWN